MKKRVIVTGIVLLGVSSLFAAELHKANNTTNLNQATSWTENAVPTADDTLVWNATVTGTATNVNVGAGGIAIAGLRVENPGGTIVTGDGSGVTAMVGSAGITLNGSANLHLNNVVQTSNGVTQVWNVLTGRLLSFGQGVGFGAGSISMTGAGAISFFGDLQDRAARTAALTVDWNGPVGKVGTTAARKKMILTDLGSGESTFNMQAGSLTVNSIDDNYGFAIGMKNKETWNITNGMVAVDAGGAFHIGGAGNYATAAAEGIVNISDAGTLVANGTLPLYMARPSTGAVATKGTIKLSRGGTLETDREFRRIIGTAANRAEIHLDGGTLKVRTSQTNFFNNINLVDVGANTTTVETVGQTTRVSIRNSLADKASEAGALRKTGAGSLGVLANYTGPTLVEEGVLGFQRVPGGTVQVASGAGITFSNATDMAAALAGDAKYILAPGSKVGLHCLATTTMPTIDVSPFGAIGFIKTGDGTLDVTGSQLANLTADIDVLWGTLQVNTASPFAPTATLSARNGGMLYFANSGSGNATVPNPIILADGQPSLQVYRSTRTTTFTNTISLLRTASIRAYSAGQTLTFNGPIIGSGDLYMTGGGGNIPDLQTFNLNAKSSYSGNTVFFNEMGSSARYNIGVDDALPITTALHLGGNTWSSSQTYSMVNLNGYNQKLVGLVDWTDAAAVRIVTNTSATASTLTISNTMDRAFSGRIGGRINMVKQGSFTQQLLGTGQGHTGTVSVAAGTLELAGTSLQNADISVANNARVLLRAGSSLTGASIAVTNGARIQAAAAGTYTVGRTTLSGYGWTASEVDRGALYFGGNNCTWNGEVAIAGTARIGNYSGNTLEKLTGPITGAGTLNIWAGGAAVTHPHVYELSGQSTWTGTLHMEATFGAHLTVKLMGGVNRLPQDVAVYFNPTWDNGANRVFCRLDLTGTDQRSGGLSTRTVDHMDHCRAVINSSASTTSTLTINTAGGTASYQGVIGASGPCVSAGEMNVIKQGAGAQIFVKGTNWVWIAGEAGTNRINANVTVNEGAIGFSETALLDASKTVTVGAGGALIAPDKATLQALTNDVRFRLEPSSAVGLYDTWDVTAADPNRLFYYSGSASLASDNTAALPNGVAFAGGLISILRDGALGDTVLGPVTAPVYLNGTTFKNSDNNPILSVSRTITLNAGGAAFTAGWVKNLTLNSKISGVGPFNVNCDSGKIILSNPLNDYVGDTTIGVHWLSSYLNAAMLQLGATEVIPHGEGKGNLIFDASATGGATLNLNGFSERVNGLLATLATATVTNTSPTLSTFTFSGTEAGCTYAGRFGGALKIVKEGTNTTQTLTGLVAHTGASRYRFAPYKNSGETCVKAGTLVVADSARFQTPGAVVAVEGGATLSLGSAAPFGGASSTVMLYVVATSASPTLNIPSGTTVTVRHFHLGGYFRKAGTYGAPGSGADYEVASLFSGGGLLNVLEQGPQEGTTLMFR
jgi:hypothetical protein